MRQAIEELFKLAMPSLYTFLRSQPRTTLGFALADSENRLKKIMDTLYRPPRSRLSALSDPGGADATASKGTAGRALPRRATAGKVPPCRPWDRGDLIRRLSTFKAMTWFGKPKDIGPVNCARRGWINTEMDVIVCEACGARHLFSTPPSWSLQQVEKAAAVFSLKLDNGHKPLCPWINNACDESLAYFPPSPPQALIEGFRERSHALLRLTTLPVISSSAIDYMKSPQLDRFLSAPVHPSITLNNGIMLVDDCRSKDLDGAAEDVISHCYYQFILAVAVAKGVVGMKLFRRKKQFGKTTVTELFRMKKQFGKTSAQKIICLCGWEPRLLPYTIDLEDQIDPSTNTTNLLRSSEEIPHEAQNITSLSSRSHNNVEGRTDIHPGEYLYDQSSTVLDCRFCGACVGLWFFQTIPRPLEFFKIIINNGHQNDELATGIEVPIAENFGRGDHTSNVENPFGLHLSIAGGPPPNKQYFRPKVSLPLVSRHLRAELLYDSCSNYHQGTLGKEDYICHQELNCNHDDGSEAIQSLKRKQSEVENSDSQLHMETNHDTGEGGSGHTSEEIIYNTPCTDVIIKDAVPCQSSSPKTVARETNDSISRVDELNFGNTSENDLSDPSISTSSVTKVNSAYSKTGEIILPLQTAERASLGKHVSIGFAKEASVSIAAEENVNHLSGNIGAAPVTDFDPIKRHRPFCPWISDEGKNSPGWKATLSSLDNLSKNSGQPPEQTAAASNLLEEVISHLLLL
ncbi:hypothetical protein KSP39_PZI019471 [Platanthera zijinensis]|uniref:C3HC-type domain-containing protein n=1 Tax=Platanthera zijinensis TaxID=2320716 RepID=A0AAP0FY18_9ASPA